MATDSNLKVVGDVDEHGGEVPYAEIRSQVIKLKEEMDRSRWQLAECLYRVHDENIFQRWGYNNFEQYIENEVQMNVRTSQYLVAMYNWFVAYLGPKVKKKGKKVYEQMISDVKEIGWTKARYLVGVVEEDNVMEWLEKAKELTGVELQMEAKRLLVEEAGGDPKKVKDSKSFTATMMDDQRMIVDQAIELASKTAESKKKGHLLSLICQDYVATNMAQSEGGQKNKSKYFDKIATQFGVKFVAVDQTTEKIVHGRALYNKLVQKLGE